MRILCLLSRGVAAAGVGAALTFTATGAYAYSTRTAVSDACHESLTFSAIRAVRNELVPAGPMPPTTENEEAIIKDVPFSVPSDLADLGAVSAVLGNRNVDLKGHDPEDLEFLAQVHADPNNQDDHCLRPPSYDEPGGDQRALADCRAFIMTTALAALDGLDAQGMPDAANRSKAAIFLEMRGDTDASLPTYWWQIGRALHAVQDGFSHTYRSQEDPHKVIAVLNYIEFVEDELDEHVDGPPHSSSMDECTGLDAFRKGRIQLATDASADLLRATLDPALDRAAKEAAVDQMLTRYLSFQEGCNADNAWCNAPERKYPEERGCVCSLPGQSARGSSAGWAGLLALGAAAAIARRRRSRSRRGRALPTALGAALGALLVPSIAAAQDTMPPPEEPPTVVMERDTGRPVEVEDPQEHEDYFPLGVHAAVGASIANPGGAASLGLRYRLSEHFLVGADGEYNPFYSEVTNELEPGVTNIYGTFIIRFPMDFENVNLRTTLNAGISRMNYDLFGVPEGTIGPFVAFNLLGIDIEMTKQLYFVVNPAYIAIPIPQTDGVPYSYPQYRISLGFQVGA